MSVGPLHGTHEPPFYVCGSDQWVCGYMEGAVRTGRAAAAAAHRYLRKISTCMRRFLPWAERLSGAIVVCASSCFNRGDDRHEFHSNCNSDPDRHLGRRPRSLDRRLLREAPRHCNGARPASRSSRARSRSATTSPQARAYGTAQVDSINTDEPARDEHLRSADFFGAESNPELRFESTAIRPLDEDTFEIEGDLTMNGVTNPVTLDGEFQGAETDPWGNERVGIEVIGQIKRGDWNMTFNQALGSGNLLVGEKVTLTLDISAVKQA